MTEIQNRLKLTAPLSAMKAGKVAMSPGEDGLIGIPFPEHSSELLSSLNAQRRAGLLCDLTLTSRGARYPTHRSVMAAVSLYFRRKFVAEEGGGGEGGEMGGGGGGFSVCQLDCVAPDALDALLEFAYTATLTIRSSGMRDVLRGAQLLGIQCVADACRDILGEKGEAEGEVVYHTERAKASRRKKDKRKLTRIESHHTNEKREPSPPPPHPSPVQDSTRSLPPSRSPSRPPSPRQEDHPPTAGQNGERRRGKMPGRGAMVNGGVPQERVLGPPPPPSDDHLSEDEDMKGLGNGGVLGSTSTCSMAEQGEVVAGAGGAGRKRKSQTPQQCPVCQKIIHGAGKLPRHMRTHTGEKPFQCTACGVRFTRNDKLKIHMRKHTGERPYPCPHCPARFLHSYDLKNHLSLHSGVRPFECPLCHKAFAREDHLMRHRKGHSCLELRTRKPRRGAGHGEEGRGVGGRGAGGRGSAPDELDSLEPHPLQPQPSAFLGHGVAVQGDRSGAQLLEAARERSLALQALTFLEAHRQPYPHLTWRGPELGVGRRVEEEAGGAHSPVLQHARWAEVEEEEEEEMGEEDEDEED